MNCTHRPALEMDLDLYRDHRECSLGIADLKNIHLAPVIQREAVTRRAILLLTAGAAGVCVTAVITYLGAG